MLNLCPCHNLKLCLAGAGRAEHPCDDQWEEEQSARLLPLLAQEQDTQVSL